MKKYSKTIKELAILISPGITDKNRAKDIVLSDDTEWTDIIEFANKHLLIPTLYTALQYKHCFSLIKDELVKDYLETVYGYNEARNKAILKQLQRIANIFSEIGVKPILLKGAAALSEEYYNDIGARVMSDIDILVPEDKLFECVELLESKGGYKAIDTTRELFSSHHWRRLYSEEGTAALELHFKSLYSNSYSYFPNEILTEHLKPSKQIDNAMVIEPIFDLYHVFLHSEISDHAYEDKALALKNLHHGAMIISSLGQTIEWKELEEIINLNNLTQKWGDYLYMQQALFQVNIPSKFLKNSAYFDKVLFNIDKRNIISDIFREKFSYKVLQRKYRFKNKTGYIIAIIQHISRSIFKLLFISQVRKNFLNYITKNKKVSKYGYHDPF